jgi:CheY-like chemotaxis protein
MIALLRGFLEGEKGYLVSSAQTGVDGVEAAMKHVPDLILIDFRLSDMGGLEVHDRLRLEPLTENIPIVYLSSFLTLRVVEQASKMGAKGFLRKPFTPSEILGKVTTALASV